MYFVVPDFFIVLATAALTALTVYLVLFYLKISRAAVYTTRQAKVKIEFLDPAAHRARMTKTVRLRANHRGVSQYIHRNLSSDGPINVVGIIPESWEYKVERAAGDLNIAVFFPHPLERKEEVETTLLADLIDSFPASKESFIYLADYDVELLQMEIRLHPDRPCIGARAFRITGAESKAVQSPKVTENNSVIKIELRNLDIGFEYCVEWEWAPLVPKTPMK